MNATNLGRRLQQGCLRLLAVWGSASFFGGIVLGSLLVLVAVWLDLLWELPPTTRAAAWGVSLAAWLVSMILVCWLARRRATPHALARRMDAVVPAAGCILTGTDLLLEARDQPPLTAGLAALSVQDAAQLAEKVPLAAVVPARPILWTATSLGLLLLAVGGVALVVPRLAQAQWLRFTDPYGDHPPFSRVIYHVKPGDVTVVYGADCDIQVTTEGMRVERLELVLEGAEPSQTVTLPLFPETEVSWRTSLAGITAPGRYYVRSHAGRSRRYRLDLLTTPRLESVQFRVTPPAYTGRAPYTGPIPPGGLAGLPGTQVEVQVRSNRPLSGGQLTVAGAMPLQTPLQPARPEAQEVVGSFTIQGPGKLSLGVVDTEGQASTETFTAAVSLLTDETPFLRLLKPPSLSLATPDAALLVELAAEDDYGISRVQLFRSLNDSRALPLDLVARPGPPRWHGTVKLAFEKYGLAPGDEIKLFGRVEDNDPAGAKGSESPIAVVRIIAQEEFERMVRARMGLEVLLSKYRQAQRRLENAAAEAEGLRKKAKESPKQDQLPEAMRQELTALARRLREDADALRALTKKPFPYDLDLALQRHLEETEQQLRRLSRNLDEQTLKPNLTPAELAQLLDQALRDLAQQKESLDREVSEPLEHLAAIFPLIEDGMRFGLLVRRQRDLEQRLQSLKDKNRVDDPVVKARMRDLQTEQQELRNMLTQILDAIEDHATRLPEDAELSELRETARDFVRDVRASGATEAMTEAEAGLAEFSGSRGHTSARQAADILEKFVERCEGQQGLAGRANVALRFKPALGKSLGETISQLLGEMGLNPGGTGGGRNGSSMTRSSLDNIGIYGQLPGMEPLAGGSGSANAPTRASGGQGTTGALLPPSKPTSELQHSQGTTTNVAVPVLYRQRVAEYFQRIAEETGGR